MRRIVPVPDVPDTDDAGAAVAEASRHLSADRMKDAHGACLEVLRSHPDHPGALALCGEILLLAGRAPAAAMLLERAADGAPGNAHMPTALGRALLAAGDPSAARRAFDRAIAITPLLALAHVGRGIALAQVGRHEAARDAMREGARQAAEDAYAHLEAAEALLAVGLEGEAAECFARALRIDARVGRFHAVAVSRLDAAGRADAATTMLGWGLILQPQDTQLRYLADAGALRGLTVLRVLGPTIGHHANMSSTTSITLRTNSTKYWWASLPTNCRNCSG